jgi:peptidoglycan/xylan/chitin deacetylase (PgdA/CDA1 family)
MRTPRQPARLFHLCFPTFALLFLVSIVVAKPSDGGPAAPWPIKPYAALLVVESWSDPASLLIDHRKDEFQPVAALLKAWTVPFDILRLDQQHLNGSHLLDRDGSIRYGVVIWLADLDSYSGQNLTALQEAVQAGTSLLVVRSRFCDPTLERILGLKYKEPYGSTDPFKISKLHFITKEVSGQRTGEDQAAGDYGQRFWVEPRGAEILVRQDRHPVLTLRQNVVEGSAVWLGTPSLAAIRDSIYWRSLFFRSMVWSLGYLIKPDVDYSSRIVMEMDDWGTSDKGFLSYWRYPTPNEETIHERLTAPLQKRGAVAIANVITGYVDRNTKRVESPWTRQFTDLFGVAQDYASTQQGLKTAVQAGVVEIQSHGWTHMQPDLDSAPGPWWTADLAGEASVSGWYTEFEDQRRGTEIAAITQRLHMRRSLEYLRKDFGVRPLSLREGGGGWSKSYANHTGRLAAEMGFGLFHAEPDFYYFLSRDLVLDMAGIGPEAYHGFERPFRPEQWPAHPDGPLILTFHDRDIALQPDFLERLFSALPAGLETLSMNQYVGLLHAGIHSSVNDGWQLTVQFDEPYCAYFAGHSSSWQLWIADSIKETLSAKGPLVLTVDGKAAASLSMTELKGEFVRMVFPAGLGSHIWKLASAR